MAVGLIIASAVGMMQKSGFDWINIVVTLVTLLLLSIKKIPAPLIVVLTLLAGYLI